MSAKTDSSAFFPIQATDIAGQVDTLNVFLIWASLISFVILMGGFIFFVIKYRRKTANDQTPYITHNHFLEFLWSFIPLVIFLIVAVWGIVIFHDMRTDQADALEIHVVAKKWNWTFKYKNGRTVTAGLDEDNNVAYPELVVPVNRPIKLIMTSEAINPKDPNDIPVLHSFFVPAFRNKQDIIPGRYTAFRFTANKRGKFNIFCTEFCGDEHSNMRGYVKVVSQNEYESWLSGEDVDGGAIKELTLAQKGKQLYTQRACFTCHSIKPAGVEQKTGPTWHNIWGASRVFDDGTKAVANENYIKNSIYKPNSQVVKGYSSGAMPSYEGQLSSEQITHIIEFMKTLK